MYIEHISGVLLKCSANSIIISVNGVGYGAEVPLTLLSQLPNIGTKMDLWIHTHVREDSIRLFGFQSFDDKKVFELLIGVSGVGPKLALAMLSTMSVKDLKNAFLNGKVEALERVPGIGKRLAQKLILELKPKLEKIGLVALSPIEGAIAKASGIRPDHEIYEDLRSALENLGFKEKDINPIVFELQEESASEINFPMLMRQALVKLNNFHT